MKLLVWWSSVAADLLCCIQAVAVPVECFSLWLQLQVHTNGCQV